MLQSLQAVAHGADTVQYFQFRKSRGGPEKYHGAVVDHEGSENTRVFRDVAAVGERLKGLDGVVGAETPAKAALIYDWHIRWALGDAKGFLQDKTGYEATVLSHYHAFWKRGIPLDVIDSTRPLDKYNLVVAPMLYMLREGVAGRIEAFVQRGGIFIATYLSGYVDDRDLCFTGGFPGPLKDTLGIWCEEIDALYPDEKNTLEWAGTLYQAFELCELIHPRGAEVLGIYGKDFYAGEPALTVNKRGEGRAYYIAPRTGADFLDDFYGKIAAEAHLKPVLEAPLPPGVSAQVRRKGETEFVFVMNFSEEAKKVDAGRDGKRTLAPREVWTFERSVILK
jgi:beta-galactosidase